ncbi:MAG: MBL fold metallo-hydrolase [Flavobacteriaceae bacterium]|nr:MBL fold metallo-hydrolase [Flavobacteriaceae bacterium]|tara:strand:+ start:25 stop:795 length:771 start_codon:yes stop_codon:yes gene_type:complete
MFKITFLGTGTSQGIPIIGSRHPVCLSQNQKDKRLRSSVLVQWKNYNYIIDCGPDFRQQMLKNNCTHLDGIIFTHEHADHTSGLDDIRPYFFRQGDIPIYGTQRVVENLNHRFGYILNSQNKYPGAPTVKVQIISKNNSFSIGDQIVTPVEVMHNSLSVMGYRIGGFSYLTDVKYIDADQMEKVKNSEVLVLNTLRIESHPTHLNLEEALGLVEELKPKKAYFTHISHLLGFHDEVSKKLPKNVHLAYDNLQINCN